MEVTTALSEGEFFRGRLVRPKWMTYSSFPAFLLLPCATLKFWFDFPFTLALISSLPVYAVLEWATRWLFCVEFPDGMFLGAATEEEMERIRRHERSGRPLGSESFVERLESAMDRLLKPGKPGPKGKDN